MTKEPGTLKEGEYHPSANTAMRWIRTQGIEKLCLWQEAFASSAIEGNRLAEICSETLDRVMNGRPVSDRYLMGLMIAMLGEDKEAAFRAAREE